VQALRAVAAFLVVLFHMGDAQGLERRYISSDVNLTQPFGTFGNFGVDLFFVISGFIMIVTTWEQFGRPGASLHFFSRRIVRIYPPYWLILVPITAVYLVRPDFVNSHSSVPPDLVASYLLLPQAGWPLLLVSWSLVAEMEFYLVFTLALALRRALLPAVVALWFASIAAIGVLFAHSANPYAQFLQSWMPLEFALGMAAGALAMTKRLHAPLTATLVGTLVLIGTCTALASPAHPVLGAWTGFALISLPCALLLYGVVGLERLRGVAAPAFLVLCGDASYAIYLWHIPILSAVGRLVVQLHLHGWVAHAVVDVLFLGLVTGISIAVYRFAERPMTRALNRRLHTLQSPRTTVPSEAGAPG
jgi:peptidoglycan/LPS O-acetylase OafA/YrhL